MILYIKYMVSLRCKMVVKEELNKLGLHNVKVDLGMVEILEEVTLVQKKELKKNCSITAWSYWIIKGIF